MKAAIALLLAATSISAHAQFACLPANPFTSVVYLNVVGARAWGWKCGSTIQYIVQLKTFYTNAACGRAIENTIRQYNDSSSKDNLDRVNRTLVACQKIPAAGSAEAALFETTKQQIISKTQKELP